MRFKAKLGPEQVTLLHSLIVPMTRLGGGDGGSGSGNGAFTRNGTVLCLDSDHVKIACKGKSQDTDGIACYAELAATGYSSIFLERRIESAAPNNAIVMELDLAQLRMALKSVMGDTNNPKSHSSINDTLLAAANLEAQYTFLKLAKRQNIPCLCIDACSAGRGSASAMIQVHHAIPVRILRHTEMPNHYPPQIPLPDVQLELSSPSAGNLRTIVDRLKGISPTVYLEANMTGELTVSIHTDGASIQAFFSKLTPRHDGCKDLDTSSTHKSARVKMDTKKLSACLHWQQHQSQLVSSALLCLVENEMVVLHVNLSPGNVGFFTYYVPVHFLSSDPCDD